VARLEASEAAGLLSSRRMPTETSPLSHRQSGVESLGSTHFQSFRTGVWVRRRSL
jgi:hypothetical protein